MTKDNGSTAFGRCLALITPACLQQLDMKPCASSLTAAPSTAGLELQCFTGDFFQAATAWLYRSFFILARHQVT